MSLECAEKVLKMSILKNAVEHKSTRYFDEKIQVDTKHLVGILQIEGCQENRGEETHMR